MRRSDRLFLLLALLVLVAGFLPGPAPTVRDPVSLAVVPIPLPTEVRKGLLGAGDTLTALLQRLGVAAAEVPVWLEASRSVLDPRQLPVGLVAEAFLDYHGVTGRVKLSPDWRATIVLERSDTGVRARREARPVERTLEVVRARVESSLFGAVMRAGEKDDLAVALADLFQWDIDFHREVRAGDTFSLLVERITSDGKTVAYGPIVAAEYVNAGRAYRAYRWRSEQRPGYYDPAGHPLRKQFLRAPLRFSKVTSRFSTSRRHPVLGRRMPHWGVDYGAPTGTPVMATSAGVVTHRGWRGGGGNTVELRHAGGWTMAYLHLSRFAAGVRVGSRVEQGQVIGYVGSTGLSTGPHLDYRVTRNGAYVNPLRIGSEPAPPLPSGDMPAFRQWTARVEPLLGEPGPLPAATAASLRSEPALGADV